MTTMRNSITKPPLRTTLMLASLMGLVALVFTSSAGATTLSITGTVVEEGTGAPLPNVEVSAYLWYEDEFGGSSWEVYDSVATHSDGTYEFSDLEPGSYKIGFEDWFGAHSGEFYSDRSDAESADWVSVTAGITTAHIDAQLARRALSVAGTVTEEGTSDPLDGIDVTAYLFNQAGGETWWDVADYTSTDTDGSYAIYGLAPGSYAIGFEDWYGAFASEYYDDKIDLETADLVVVTSGAALSGVEAALTSLPPCIAGTVTEEGTGVPLEDIAVTAYYWSADMEAWVYASDAATREDGTYELFGLDAGQYKISFEDFADRHALEYYSDRPDQDSADLVEVALDLTTPYIDAALTPLPPSVTGTVTEEGTGDPLGDVEVTAYALGIDEGTGETYWRYVGYASTDAVGHYGIYGLTPGGYKIEFEDWYGLHVTEYWDDRPSLDAADYVTVLDDAIAEGVDAALTRTPVEYVLIDGPTRIGTAIKASQTAFDNGGAEYVVIATAYNWPDALGGSGLAGALDAPILLTAPNSLSSGVAEEIRRLGATKAVVLGGEPAVSKYVMQQIDALSGVSAERIGGANRYETASKVASRTIDEMNATYWGFDGTAFVATGLNFPDALAASPLAAGNGWPIYLANPAAGSNASLATTMSRAGVTHAVVLGGANVVSAAVADELDRQLGPPPERLSGADRYATAIEVATYGVEEGNLEWDALALATGQNFPDALAGGVLQGKSGSVLLLTPTASLHAGVADILAANRSSISEVRYLGGLPAISQMVRDQVAAILD